MVRDGDEWREVTWDEAFARCEELLRPIVEEHGIAAVTAYIGNPTVHNYSLSRYTGAVAGIPRLPVVWSAGTVDQWPKNLACAQLFGNPWSIPVPDIARTDLFVVMGANPHASQGSLLSCPDILGEIDRIRERGGRTIVVDPRRTGTAERADEWIPIIPGMDAAFLLAIVNVLDTEGLVRLGPLDGRVQGIDEVLLAARDFTPEAVADACGVPAERIRELARELGDDRAGGDLRPHRPVQPGVRHARIVAGRRRQRAHRPPRRRGRRDVPHARRSPRSRRPPAGGVR